MDDVGGSINNIDNLFNMNNLYPIASNADNSIQPGSN
jgi:hypothetical protein